MLKKVLIGLAIFVVIVMTLVVLVVGLVSANSNKLICNSNEGNITIMYNDKGITGYTAKGMSYDLDGQKEYANQVGIEKYLEEFMVWFSTNTTGSCTK